MKKVVFFFTMVFGLLNNGDNKRIVILIFLMLICASSEVLGLGLVLPFVGLLSTPEAIHSYTPVQYFYNVLGMETEMQFIIVLGCMVMLLFAIKNILSMLLVWLQTSFYLGKQYDIQGKLFECYLSAPYIFHITHNSALLIRNITSEVSSVCNGILAPLLVVISEGIILIAIIIFLAFINPMVVAISFVLVSLLFLFLTRWLRPKVSKHGVARVHFGGRMINEVNQGLGGIKAIILSNSLDFFCEKFRLDVHSFTQATKSFVILNALPRAVAETFSIILIVSGMLIALLLGVENGIIVSTVTVFAVAFIRIMPSISKLIQAVNTLAFNQKSLEVVYQELNLAKDYDTKIVNSDKQPKKIKKCSFEIDVKFCDVSYTYPSSENPSIDNVSLSIKPGDNVALVGKSGAGKSTLIELLLGLLRCDKGVIKVDDVDLNECSFAWAEIIGYVPQSIFIMDDTVRNNIAFGVEKDDIDDELIWDVLAKSSLKEKVKSLPNGLDTMLGERGTRFSGGEIQRIGIARALYTKPKLLIFDEATSALDNETEQALSKTINALKGSITLVIIAHRLTTVEKCDKIYFMSEGEIIDSGSFHDLCKYNEDFRIFSNSGA